MEYSQNTVIELPSKENVEKCSVVAEGSAEIVTIFSVDKTPRKIIRCHSGYCNVHIGGNKRLVTSLGTSKNLCAHLIEFRDWRNVIVDNEAESDDDDGDAEETTLPQEKVIYN